MPVDRAVIATRCAIDKDFASGAAPDMLAIPSAFRHMVVQILCGTRRRHDGDVPFKVIHLDSYGGVELYLEFEIQWVLKKITFNPGKVVYGHNGKITSENDFLLALSVLINLVTPLLHNSSDFIHIVPGLDGTGRAFWKKLEIPFHSDDQGNALYNAFKCISHPAIRKPPIAVAGESIKMASSDGGLTLNFYRKDIEVLAKHRRSKYEIARPMPLFRFEVGLAGKQLLEYLGTASNTKKFDSQSRVVRFNAADLRSAHRKICSRLRGCYAPITPSKSPRSRRNKLGIFMGWIASESSLSLDDMLRFYGKKFGLEANTKSRLLNGANQQLSELSRISPETFFSEAAWLDQPGITIPELEAVTQARHRFIDVHPLVAATYGSPLSHTAN
jgi:hypothetical protein